MSDRRKRRRFFDRRLCVRLRTARRSATRSPAIEINVSCPNVASEGETFGCDPDLTARVVEAVRATTDKTLIVKLSPNVTDITAVARQAEASGADALAVINTVRGMAIDVETWRPRLGNVTGGLSGPAIRPIAVLAVYEVARAVSIPIVGQGGIENVTDALEFFLAGATAVSIGTANFTDPRIPERIVGRARCISRAPWLASRRRYRRAGQHRHRNSPINTKETKDKRYGATDRRARRSQHRRMPNVSSTSCTNSTSIVKIGLEALYGYPERIFAYLRSARRAHVRGRKVARYPAHRRRGNDAPRASQRAHRQRACAGRSRDDARGGG